MATIHRYRKKIKVVSRGGYQNLWREQPYLCQVLKFLYLIKPIIAEDENLTGLFAMETLLSSFSKLEYLTIFSTFVYGFVATQFFFGWGTLISNRRQIVFSTEHLTWTILTFMLLIDVWWGSWLKGFILSKHRLYFYLSLVSPLIFYILSIIQFPPFDQTANQNLPQYFNRIRRYNLIVFILLLISFYFNDFFFQKAPLIDFAINSIALILALSALLFKRRWIDTTIIIMGAIILLIHILTLKSFTDSQFSIENFAVTEYLTIFAAFIYGAVATRFFSGWGSLIHNAEKVKLNKEYLAWTIFVFVLLMDLWWGQWKRQAFIAHHLGYFVLSLTTPIICYFQSVVMFPVIDKEQVTIDLTLFYKTNKKVIYILLGLMLATNCIVSNVIEKEYMFSFTNILRATAAVMGIAGMLINRKTMDYVLLTLAYLMVLCHALFASD